MTVIEKHTDQKTRLAFALRSSNVLKFKLSVLLAAFSMLLGAACSANTIATIPTKEGIVIVADKRVFYNNGVGIDIGNKIHQLGKYGLVISTGTSVASTPSDENQTTVDAKELIKNYFWDRRVHEGDSIYPHKQQIQEILHFQYNELFKRLKRSDWLTYTHGSTADETLLIRYNPTTKQFEGLRFEVLVDPDGAGDGIQVNTNIIASSRFDYPKAMLMGLDSYEVEAGIAPYQMIRNQEWFDRTIVHPTKLGQHEALDAALRFVELVHENHPTKVGDTVDGVVITQEEGVVTKFDNVSFEQARESLKAPDETKAQLRLDPLP
jgi:hypothetical protein